VEFFSLKIKYVQKTGPTKLLKLFGKLSRIERIYATLFYVASSLT
jgi:hypothetical protein